MDLKSFKYKMIDYKFAVLSDKYILFKKKGKWLLWDADDDTEEYVELEDERVKPLIEKLETIIMHEYGGRGAGGSKGKFSWNDGSSSGRGRKKKNDSQDFPARINTRIKQKSIEGAIAEFRKMHGNDKVEHGALIDKYGFAHNYAHGNSDSVRTAGDRRGKVLVHNHPNDSSFSPSDLLNVGITGSHGVVATHSKGYRMFTRGNHFDAEGFAKAVAKARKGGLRGKNTNDAVDKFLTRNQKKYGYKFVNVKDK